MRDELGKESIHCIKIRETNEIFHKLGGQHDTEWIWESGKRLSKTTIKFETMLGGV